MDKNSKIFVIGDKDILRGSFIRYFQENGFNNVLDNISSNINLMSQDAVRSFFKKEKPEYVFLNHIKSSGIAANIKYPAEFIYTNLQVQNNVIQASFESKVGKLLFLSSSCIYPSGSTQPIKESCLLKGELEGTSSFHAVSKIAGIKMCEAYHRQYGMNFVSAVPATIYGPEDDFDSEGAHVISALIKKFDQARLQKAQQAVVWGRGSARREFIYINDLIEAEIFLMKNYNLPGIINLGVGEDISIGDLAVSIKDIVGFKGEIIFDELKPEGVSKKLLDSSRINKLGWEAKTTLDEGIRQTYEWYKKFKEEGIKR